VRGGAEGRGGPRRAEDGGRPSSVPGRCRGPSTPMEHTAAQAALPSGARQEPGPVGCLERLNTPLPYVALAPGPASHLPWGGPGASQSRAPLGLPSRTPTPLSLPPLLSQANTSKSNVLLSLEQHPPHPLRKGQRPLPVGHMRQHPLHPVHCLHMRPLRVAGGTHPSSLAPEGDEKLVLATLAARPRREGPLSVLPAGSRWAVASWEARSQG
jgi:hypothetical protein